MQRASGVLKTSSWEKHGTVVQPPYHVRETKAVKEVFNYIFCGGDSSTSKPVVVKAGNLSSSTIPDGSFKLGDFEFVWRPTPLSFSPKSVVMVDDVSGSPATTTTTSATSSSASALTIRYQDKDYWQSPPGANFVGGAQLTRLEITDSRGSIDIQERVATLFTQQTVHDIHLGTGNSLVFKGRLASSAAGSSNEKPDYVLVFRLIDNCPEALGFDLQIFGGGGPVIINQAHLLLHSSAEEAIYGFGKQVSQLNCKGYQVPIVVEEGGIGRGDESVPSVIQAAGVGGDTFSSYSPSPLFVTNTGRAMFLVNTEPSVFDMRSTSVVTVRVQSSCMQGCLLAGTDPLHCIELVTHFVGRMPPLPSWVFKGAIVGLQGGTKRVRSIWDKMKKYNTPISGFWLQDWVGKRTTVFGKQLWWNWTLNPRMYPDFGKLVADLKQAGIEMGLYINPFLVKVPKSELVGRRNLYKEAEDKGFLVKRDDGQVYTTTVTFEVALVDLSNEQAREWLKDVIKIELLATGAKFWMADFGEAAPFEAAFASKQSGLSYHNQYPVDWQRLNREAIQEAGFDNDAWFFTRSGFLDTPTYSTAMWLGDQNVNWGDNDGLPSAVTGLLSGGFSGLSFSHSDIGGYTSVSHLFFSGYVRDRELLYRWMELNAFTAIFRTHEGLEPGRNTQVYSDDFALSTFAFWAKVYAALSNYRIHFAKEASFLGHPIVRHPILHYPTDQKLVNIKDAFMLGSDFYVSPIVRKGETWKTVYLPKGQWVHLWTGKAYAGGKSHKLAAPVGKPPVFHLQTGLANAVIRRLQQNDILKYF